MRENGGRTLRDEVSDITLSAEDAKELADFLVRKGLGRHHRLVTLLDPSRSLLNAVADAITARTGYGDKDDSWNKELAATVLSIVRDHVEAMPAVAQMQCLMRDDVLRLLNGGDK